MKIVMVLTSHDRLGDTGRKTGFWLEEFAAPYFVFRDAGVELTLASPKGGQPPIDPKSDLPENQTAAMARFKGDEAAQKALAHTIPLADGASCRLRHGVLRRRARSDVGSRGEPRLDRLAGILLRLRQTDRARVPLARRAPPRHLQRRSAREGKARHRVYE